MRRLAFLAVLLTPSLALAGNDDGILVGSQASLVAGAVVATGDDAASAFYNPAALAGATVDSIDANGTAFTLRFYRAEDVLRGENGAAVSDSYSDLASAPSAVGFARRLTDRLTLGLGIFLPQRDALVLDPQLTTGTGEQTQTALISIGLDSSRFFGGVSLGFRATDELRLGATLFGTYASTRIAVEFAGAGGQPDMPDYVTGGALNAAIDTVGLTGAIGAQWDALPWLTLGASVLAPTLQIGSRASYTLHEIDGTRGENAMLAFGVDTGMGIAPDLSVGAPWRVRLGASVKAGATQFSLDGDVQTALAGDSSRRALVNARFGVRTELSDSFAIGGGLFTDRSPTVAIDGFGTEQVDYYGGTAGVTWSTAYDIARDEEADEGDQGPEPGSMRFSTTLAIRYALGIGEIGGLRLSGRGADAMSEVVRSDVTAHEIALNLGSSLTF